MTAPEKIIAYETKNKAYGIMYEERNWSDSYCPFMPKNATLYVRADLHETALADKDKRIKELETALNALQPLPIMDAPLDEKCVYKFNGKIFIGTMKSDGFIQSMGWTDQHIEDEHPDDCAIPLSAIKALFESDTK